MEIEKFVDREYSRNEERPTPWPLQALLKPPPTCKPGSDEAKATEGAEDLPGQRPSDAAGTRFSAAPRLPILEICGLPTHRPPRRNARLKIGECRHI